MSVLHMLGNFLFLLSSWLSIVHIHLVLLPFYSVVLWVDVRSAPNSVLPPRFLNYHILLQDQSSLAVGSHFIMLKMTQRIWQCSSRLNHTVSHCYHREGLVPQVYLWYVRTRRTIIFLLVRVRLCVRDLCNSCEDYPRCSVGGWENHLQYKLNKEKWSFLNPCFLVILSAI